MASFGILYPNKLVACVVACHRLEINKLACLKHIKFLLYYDLNNSENAEAMLDVASFDQHKIDYNNRCCTAMQKKYF